MAKSRFRDEFRFVKADKQDLEVLLSRTSALRKLPGVNVPTDEDLDRLYDKFVVNRRRRLDSRDRRVLRQVLSFDVTVPTRIVEQGELGYTHKAKAAVAAFRRLGSKYHNLLWRAA
jgi:hypothetical protein